LFTHHKIILYHSLLTILLDRPVRWCRLYCNPAEVIRDMRKYWSLSRRER